MVLKGFPSIALGGAF